ncbi:MAG: Type II secretory pathway, pullulanase PulA and related glycosidase [Lachnospiraceae bacterium]|nr:Type II secretory pathway, pullulanase PulA and related glycosidase [Lachnospiraceae bacterium]
MGDYGFKILQDDSRTPGTRVCRDGVHFGFYASASVCPALLLYKKGSEEVAAVISFPEPSAPGNFYSMKVKLPADAYEYNFLDGDEVVTDPYARRLAGRETYGQTPSFSPHGLRGAFATGKYAWGEDRLPELPFHETVMYHLHVRGFTMHKNSGVRGKGTFSGLRRKIPYLKALGVNQVKLMPVYDFSELEIPEYLFRHQILEKDSMGSAQQDQMETCGSGAVSNSSEYILDESSVSQRDIMAHAFERPHMSETDFRKNYWGYGPGFYFAPKASYASSDRADLEFKDLVKAFHANGMEIILEFAFDTGTDIGTICDCLNYWADEYHVDGFSMVGRDDLSAELAKLPLFASRKLICSWFPESTIRENRKEHRIAQLNDGFMNDARRLLKGDAGMLDAFSYRTRQNPTGCAQINYMTNHDGFTMLDLVSYNMKYNDENGEMGRDGSDSNFSWNCGEEGPCAKRKITQLRLQQRKNAYAMMLLSQGTPMLLAGDEFGNTQLGNNNPWCQDNECTWLDWSRSKTNRELTEYVRQLIAFRKKHPMLHQKAELQCADYRSTGYPDLSYHGERAWYGDLRHSSLHMGCMYSGFYAGEQSFLYIAWNFHWEEQQFALPLLPEQYFWYRVFDTSLANSFPQPDEQEQLTDVRIFAAPPRTVVVLEGRMSEST